RYPHSMTTRRSLLKGALASALLPMTLEGAAHAAGVSARVHDGARAEPISPYIYGSNEFGRMVGGEPSIVFDKRLRTPFRRLGGNLMTTYNWTNNTQNAGKDWYHANVLGLAEFLDIAPEQRAEPAAVIAKMHRNSLDCGAQSLVTLQLAGYVAADANGEVPESEHAPSARFVPLRWSSDTEAFAPIDKTVCDMPQLIRRLVETYGQANTPTGIRAYSLDNEPGLWAETHPRIVLEPPTVKSLLERSIAAAKVIKTIDPHALVFGPASWGVTEFQNFQHAPDWADYAHFGSFIAAYLDAFRVASDAFGARLLDVLDVHWYPQSNLGDLLNTEDPAHAEAVLAGPRSLTEAGFAEDSWVIRALPVSDKVELALPILPSLNRLIAKHYPGTLLGVTEFNFGGVGQLATGLAVADVLGRFAQANVAYACHWGPLDGQVGNAFALYRDYDGKGGMFPPRRVRLDHDGRAELALYGGVAGTRLHVIAINRSTRELPLRLHLDQSYRTIAAYGFDASRTRLGPLGEGPAHFDPFAMIALPARSARHFVLDRQG
ncbi:glycoside hydrolase family 44 protein, partial [Ancylobacter sp. G4_0304]|uniref:glycoside hydrolase family 44 protein n=1 Tax=Ancylobacter sp. G4_0304 TaxID=3114289 RepID=UPI0039C6C6DE